MKGFRTFKKLFGNLSIGYHAGGDVNHYLFREVWEYEDCLLLERLRVTECSVIVYWSVFVLKVFLVRLMNNVFAIQPP